MCRTTVEILLGITTAVVVACCLGFSLRALANTTGATIDEQYTNARKLTLLGLFASPDLYTPRGRRYRHWSLVGFATLVLIMIVGPVLLRQFAPCPN